MTSIHAARLRSIAAKYGAADPESSKDLLAAASYLESMHTRWANAADERDKQSRRAAAAERSLDQEREQNDTHYDPTDIEGPAS